MLRPHYCAYIYHNQTVLNSNYYHEKKLVFSIAADEIARHFNRVTERSKEKWYWSLDALGVVLELKKFVVAKYGAEVVILAGRKQDALDDPMKKKDETPSANLRSLILHLASLESVKNAAAEVNAYAEPIDVLINNAAIMASPYYTTKDGFEAQIGTNHLGPFLFTNLIIPRILASNKNPRIVNVSSVGHIFSPIRFNDPFFENGKSYDKWKSYGQSKTANILFARELSKRYASKRLTAFSLHPGGIQTNLGRDVKEHELSEPLYDHDATVSTLASLPGRPHQRVHQHISSLRLIQASSLNLEPILRTVSLPAIISSHLPTTMLKLTSYGLWAKSLWDKSLIDLRQIFFMNGASTVEI